MVPLLETIWPVLFGTSDVPEGEVPTVSKAIGLFSTTVAKEMVHRAAVAEVYVTAIEKSAENEFLVYAQWPRKHYFYRMEGGNVDGAILVETFRQATILLAHWGYGASLDSHFLLPYLRLTRVSAPFYDSLKPMEVTMRITTSEVTGPPGAVRFLRAGADISGSGISLAHITAGARIVSRVAYNRFRGECKQAATHTQHWEKIPMQLAGVAATSSILLAEHPQQDCWRLATDLSDPVFFDHPLDHVPGAVLIEAARQAIAVVSGNPVIDFHTLNAKFTGMVDLDARADVGVFRRELTPDSLSSWCVTISTEAGIQASFEALCRIPTQVRPSDHLEPTANTGITICAQDCS